jgi:hypothetical protein
MTLKSRAITLVSSTITDVLAAASLTKTGDLTDPCPIQIMNSTSTATYVGGPDVSAANGFPLVQNVPFIINAYSNDYPFVFAAGTPTINVIVGRQ